MQFAYYQSSRIRTEISLRRITLRLWPKRLGRADLMVSLANILHTRFKQCGAISDLEEVIALERNILELYSEGHPDRVTLLHDLALHLHSRFQQLGTLSDLDESIALRHDALELLPQGHPDRAISLHNLAYYLYYRFQQLGTLSDLDESIALRRDALKLRPQVHPDRAISLHSLACYLRSRFKQLGALSDLDEAIALARDALELRPQGHPDRALSLANLSDSLHSRFEQHETLSDLNEALALGRDALELRPRGHPNRASSLANLADILHSRFQQLGTLSDLDEAVSLQRNALELRPQGHRDRAVSLHSLAYYLHSRFQQHGTQSELDEALALGRDALELRPQGNPDRAISLHNLAYYLHSRFQQLGTLSDLDEALALARDALELRPQGHPRRAASLNNLASYLRVRFKQLGVRSDLDEALSLQRNALELRPPGHPDRLYSVGTIVLCLYARFSVAHDIRDLQEISDLYSHLSDVSHHVSFTILQNGERLIQAAEKCKHTSTVLAYQMFLRLIVQHLATLPSLRRHFSILKKLMTSAAVDAFSACVRCGNLTNAVELLEQGRGVFWNQLTRLRSPLDEVKASGDTGKKLAERFMQLATLLRTADRTMPDGRPNTASRYQNDRAWRLNIQLQDIVTEIRKLPSLSRFLQPPLFSDLRHAASDGPVIIVNASQYTCDSLIILFDKDPVHVVLPITKARVSELSLHLHFLTSRAKSRDVTKDLLSLLRELWDVVVSPIVKVLQQYHSGLSRIWWCPTAEFSHLPLHAAGPFRKGQPMLSDLYISSYTPTLTALIRARQKRLHDSSIGRPRFLVVGQAHAPGQCELTSVNTELSTISQRIGSDATLTCLEDQNATITKVAEELTKNEFVHLACHGIPDRKQPFQSGFALCDGLFKVEDIMRYDLQNAKFAYLSACHTTVGDEESPDEVIHLAAAMQFAGFHSVIGTMWAVDDAHTNEITSKYYEYMVDESGCLDHTCAALALHQTMRSLRSSKIPLDQQVMYVHIGA